jgi:hypothetical protein
MSKQQHRKSVGQPATLTIPELEQSKAAVLSTLSSVHSRRSYKHAIERFISWYCDEPRLAFNRSAVVQYRSSLESLCLSGERSTFIYPRSGDWRMNQLRAGGSARNSLLESGELRESRALGGRLAIG